MFSYKLPDGGLKSRTFLNAAREIKFEPPVYEQRYITTIRIIEDTRWKQTFKKVVEFGCAEMALLPLLRRIDNIEHLMEVDIDEALLEQHCHRAKPLISDYLNKRKMPLRVEILKGSVDASVDLLRDVDVVIALELLEHLYPNVLDNVPKNIFGFMQPKLAIFSTPNCEYNVMFNGLLENGFRHHDHKFEWNRAEFKKWALDICQRYPNYSVAFIGIGLPLPDRKEVGHVSQMAIFARNDVLEKPLVAPINTDIPADPNPDIQYKEIFSNDFPFDNDKRTKEQKIWDEAQYEIRCSRIQLYFNRDRNIYQVPLKVFDDFIKKIDSTEDELRSTLLKHDVVLEGDFIILPEFDEDDESYRRYDDCYDDEYGLERGFNAEDNDELSAGRTDQVAYESEENWD